MSCVPRMVLETSPPRVCRGGFTPPSCFCSGRPSGRSERAVLRANPPRQFPTLPLLLAIKAVWSTIAADMPKQRSRKSSRHPVRRRANGATVTKLPKNAVTRVVTLRAKEGQHMLLAAELRALIAPSRREEGCLRFDLHGCVDQPGTFLLHEVWESREDHTAHTRTPHFLRWDARKDALLASREAAFWRQLA